MKKIGIHELLSEEDRYSGVVEGGHRYKLFRFGTGISKKIGHLFIKCCINDLYPYVCLEHVHCLVLFVIYW